MDEALRQQGLLQALSGGAVGGLRERGERAERGLEAYRANAEAIAERALAAAFTTVQAMVGAYEFRQLARAFWQAQPPQRGDLGEWGDGFAAWLQAHPSMAPWPYLGDSARLDFALHCNERAADAVLDTSSLMLLESVDPSQLRIRLMPGTALLRSAWPVASIYRAHQLAGDDAERAFERVREAMAAGQGEDALVARRGWRGVVETLGADDARWTESILAGANLAVAFEQAGAGFDFAAWLQTAIRHSWLKDVVAAND
ncbi:MAG: putative DNA-binding domain-containing protein [Burkholderiales bacterium]